MSVRNLVNRRVASFYVVFVKYSFINRVRRSEQILGIVASKPFLASFSAFVTGYTSQLSRFQRNCDNDASAYVRTAPLTGGREELCANLKV